MTSRYWTWWRCIFLANIIEKARNLFREEVIIQLEFTTHCNHDCVYCPRYLIGKTRPLGDIAPEMADLLVERLGTIKDKYNLTLSVSGFGEPDLYPEFIELIYRLKAASKASMRLNTNASLLHRYRHTLIISKHVDHITLSLNLPNEELYRKYTGQDSYEAVKNNIAAFLREKGSRKPAADIRLIKMPDTLPYIDEAREYWEKHLNKNDRVSVAELANWGGLIGVPKPQMGTCRYLTRQAGKHLTIDMEGHASICCFTIAYSHTHPLFVGNIKDHSIDELLRLARIRAGEIDVSMVCKDCDTRRPVIGV